LLSVMDKTPEHQNAESEKDSNLFTWVLLLICTKYTTTKINNIPEG